MITQVVTDPVHFAVFALVCLIIGSYPIWHR